MASRLMDDLNPEQRRAVEILDSPLLVLAGAGSGKTRVLTYKIGYILEKGFARAQEILAVTFTNKAASEMKGRVEALIEFPAEGMWIGTFHSICARILRIEGKYIGYSSNFTIYDTDDQIRLIQQLMEAFNIDQKIIKPRRVQYLISDCKNKMQGAEQFEQLATDFVQRQIARVYREYEAALRRSNAFDFDDLLIKLLEVFTRDKSVLEKYQTRFKYVLVDEYQDTNKAQYYIVKLLSAAHRRIYVVGDEDQSIYRWRGADIENILSFEKDYPDCEVVRLEQNYRSTRTILNAANAVVANNLRRLGKNLWSKKDRGDKIQVIQGMDENDEALRLIDVISEVLASHHYACSDIAVLYRTNAQSRALEDQLRRANIPYHIVGGTKFYERKEVKDVLAYLRVLVNSRDSLALRRIINYPTRGIGAVSQQKLEQYSAEKQVNLYDVLLNVEEVEGITLSVKEKIQSFVETLENFRRKLTAVSAFELAREVVEAFGLKLQYSPEILPEDEARLENINELLNSIAIFSESDREEVTLEKYLEEVSLFTDLDRWDPNFSEVTLMTLHSAKGLEFPIVIIAGLEDGLFPLFRALDNEDDLEEERRLFYVGMTRAREQLYLSWAGQRRRFTAENAGMAFRSTPSRFLREIPTSYKNNLFSSTRASHRRETWDASPEGVSAYAAQMLDDHTAYRIGAWVQHQEFGKGQVLGVESVSAGTKLTVLFKNKQLKKLIAEYANLQLLD